MRPSVGDTTDRTEGSRRVGMGEGMPAVSFVSLL